jgi:toxin FitB
MLLDSNIIIYAYKPEYQLLRDFLKHKELSASMISYLETLGYHKITDAEKNTYNNFLA